MVSPVDENGVIRSQVFPGLWLAADNLLAGNMGRVLAVLLRRVSCSRTYCICAAVSEVGKERLVDAVKLSS
jgi:hypothetical protein